MLTGAADAEEQAELEHRLIGFVPVTAAFTSATTCRWRTRRSTPPWRPAGRRSWSAGPASTCGRRWRTSRWSRPRPTPPTPSSGHPRPATRRRSSGSTWTAPSSTSGSTLAPRRSSPPAPPKRPAAPTPLGPSRTARKALGFDELLAGDIEAMKKRSRNYARRQLTWQRKIPNLHAIDRTDLSDAEVAERIARSGPNRLPRSDEI